MTVKGPPSTLDLGPQDLQVLRSLDLGLPNLWPPDLVRWEHRIWELLWKLNKGNYRNRQGSYGNKLNAGSERIRFKIRVLNHETEFLFLEFGDNNNKNHHPHLIKCTIMFFLLSCLSTFIITSGFKSKLKYKNLCHILMHAPKSGAGSVYWRYFSAVIIPSHGLTESFINDWVLRAYQPTTSVSLTTVSVQVPQTCPLVFESIGHTPLRMILVASEHLRSWETNSVNVHHVPGKWAVRGESMCLVQPWFHQQICP